MTQFFRTVTVLLVAVGLMLASLAGVAAQGEDKPTVGIGSKDFTEQLIVAEMVALLLEDAGYPVERQLNLGGTVVVHQALVNGDIDIYVEYTGTGLLAILGMELRDSPREGDPSASPAATTGQDAVGQDAVYDIVAAEYDEQFNLEWLEPWGFNNTYAIAVSRELAEEHDLQTISDMEAIADDLTLGATQEFLVRPDGLPGFEEHYGFGFDDSQGLDPGLVYSAIESGNVDVITATATDGRIQALDLVVLEDDQGFFPPYYAVPVVRQDLLESNPEVADILNQLAGQIDDATMTGLNFQVDEGGANPRDVAQAFLEDRGLIGGD